MGLIQQFMWSESSTLEQLNNLEIDALVQATWQSLPKDEQKRFMKEINKVNHKQEKDIKDTLSTDLKKI